MISLTEPCPICAKRGPGHCMKLCTGGQVDIDALARTLAMEERTIAWAEGNNRPAPPINEKWWVEYRQHYWEMAHSHLNALKEIY